MRLPRPDTRAMRVLRLLLAHDGLTVEQTRTMLDHYITPGDLERTLDTLVKDGCATLRGEGRYEASRAACESMLPWERPAAGPAVPRAERPNLLTARPYDPKRYGMSSRGLRPGSNDHRDWPSLFSSKSQPTHPKEQP